MCSGQGCRAWQLEGVLSNGREKGEGVRGAGAFVQQERPWESHKHTTNQRTP